MLKYPTGASFRNIQEVEEIDWLRSSDLSQLCLKQPDNPIGVTPRLTGSRIV
jgi:hypothetical protein